MRIGLIAPPWVSVPPTQYGGTEAVVDQLARGFVAAGHEVLLWTTGDSSCPVPKGHVLGAAATERMGASSIEIRHVIGGYAAMATWGADIVHDHSLIGPILSAQFPNVPVVTTNHGPFTEDLLGLYRWVTPRVGLIAISEDQARAATSEVTISEVIHHGLDPNTYTVGEGGGDERGPYFLFLGRMARDKGVHLAIDAVKRAGGRLLIAAKMREEGEKRYFAECVEPELDDDIQYLGEADHATKVQLLQGATALINPIQWSEPFGLVMIEALASGTPVLASPLGAAREIVDHGTTGYLCHDAAALQQWLARIGDIDRSACRTAALGRFSTARMVSDHVSLFERLIDGHAELAASVDQGIEQVLAVGSITGQ